MDWQSLPPLSALRAFAALAETGSAVAAGVQLNVSHAAISQQVKRLEAHLNLSLVDRSGRKLSLTAEGRELAEALALGFGAIARSIETLTQSDSSRPLQISVTPAFAAQWLMPRMLDFRDRYPDLDVMINPTPEIVALEPGGIDIAIRSGSGHWPGLEAELLLSAPMVVVAAPSLLKGRVIETPADIEGLPWVQEFGSSEATNWFLRRGVKDYCTGAMMQVPGNLMLDGVRQGQGVALTILDWVQEDIDAGRLLLLFTEPEEHGYYIVTRPGPLRPKARDFVTWLRRQARANKGAG